MGMLLYMEELKRMEREKALAAEKQVNETVPDEEIPFAETPVETAKREPVRKPVKRTSTATRRRKTTK